MEVASRPYVLDTGSKAKEHCKATSTVSLSNGITLAYQVYELRPQQQNFQVGAGVDAATVSGREDKVLMIMGFAACGAAWLPTLRELFSRGEKAAGLEVAIFDNRGIGRSSCPSGKEHYTTDKMAADGLALMDHLGWHRAHVVGHSMGAMISARLALAEPDRVASLTLISTTGGGTEAIPLNARALWTALKGMSSRAGGAGAAGGIGAAAAAAAVKRARVDLAFHFSPRLLKTKDPVSGRSVKDLLVEEYVAASKENGPQPKAGEEGHLNAVMKHGLSASERRRLAAAGFPIKVLHGSEDIVAEPRHARRLAGQLRAPLVMMDGAHFITRDCAVQVVDELLDTVEAVRQGATHVDAVHMLPERVSCFCCA